MKTSKRTRRSRTTSRRSSGLRAARLLECGHPGQPSNLIRGKCGTCKCATDWEKLSDETSNPDLKILTHKIAQHFRKGPMIYDRNGKTLLEWTDAMRPHSNEKGQP